MRALLVRLLFSLYRGLLSPLMHWIAGPGFGCRFEPTCGQYAHEAVQTHGILRGSLLAARRVARCHPWGDSGYDPVPRAIAGSTPKTGEG